MNLHAERDHPDRQTWPLQGDYSTPITAFAETLSDLRATNVRPGDICVSKETVAMAGDIAPLAGFKGTFCRLGSQAGTD